MEFTTGTTIQQVYDRIDKSAYGDASKGQLRSSLKSVATLLGLNMETDTVYVLYESFDEIMVKMKRFDMPVNTACAKYKHLNMIFHKVLNRAETTELQMFTQKWVFYRQHFMEDGKYNTLEVEKNNLDPIEMEPDNSDVISVTSETDSAAFDTTDADTEAQVEPDHEGLEQTVLNGLKFLIQKKQKALNCDLEAAKSLVISKELLDKSEVPNKDSLSVVFSDLLEAHETTLNSQGNDLEVLSSFLKKFKSMNF
jgi:hypothetical protein